MSSWDAFSVSEQAKVEQGLIFTVAATSLMVVLLRFPAHARHGRSMGVRASRHIGLVPEASTSAQNPGRGSVHLIPVSPSYVGEGGIVLPPVHYQNPGLYREQDPFGTGLIALGTACAERELSTERSRHRWAGIGGSAESHGPKSRHSCAKSPLSSRHRPIHN
jgi:hypothetical protein